MKALNIAILGTRGIPNHYGGFEQVLTTLAPALVARGHAVTVFNSHNHPYRQSSFQGVQIIHCYDPEHRLGTAGQFIYDLNCILSARKQNFDVLLFMGYTSSSVWGKLYPKKAVVVSNMDGMEWQRSKYKPFVQSFLKRAEKMAVRHSQFLIADSPAIASYLCQHYEKEICFIPYGVHALNEADTSILQKLELDAGNYHLAIARLEPENNLEMLIEGWLLSGDRRKLVVVGNLNTAFAKRMLQQYGATAPLVFAGAIFQQKQLCALRRNCSLYFHGHSVGGTNPSLLEAMADQALIAAHDNLFNRAVLGTDALYFTSAADVAQLLSKEQDSPDSIRTNNLAKVQQQYSWETVTNQYETYLLQCVEAMKK